ncbi:MAG: CehA/McbA family metallohydrolase, partial [Clostridia bacterium]|nr:CehA/McbA family metallohydrolase [Clostridia bacterium]
MRTKRLSALLLAVLMTLSLLPLSAFAREGASVRDTEVIVKWDFESETNTASEANAANIGAAVTRESSDIVFSYTGGDNSNEALSSTYWNEASANAPKYYTASVDATGYEGLSVSAAFRASNTGPKNIALQYSLDGAEFTEVTGGLVVLNGTAWGRLSSVSLPADADGASTLVLRFAVTDTVSANGGTIASSGTLRIDDLTVSGTASEDDPQPQPTPDPGEGKVMWISEALAAEDGTEGLCVSGIVTFIDGRNVFIEDGTGGIVIYLNAALSTLSLGDRITATGTRATYKGLPELSGVDATDPEQFAVDSSGNELPVMDATISDILENSADLLCRRVKISSAVMGAVNNGGNTPLTQGDASMNIYKMPANDAVEGDTVNVTAVVGIYNTLQLRVALASDVEVVDDADETPDPTEAPSEPPAPTEVPDPSDPIYDPIDPEDYPNYMTIDQVLALTETGDSVTVVGQVAMKFGNFGNLNSAVLGDVVNNEIIGLQIYDMNNIDSYVVGSVVAVIGTVGDYGGVRQLSSITQVQVLSTDKEPMQAQEVTISELQRNIENYLSEFVVIKDAILGAYSSSGSTQISDSDGNTINIYRAAAYPEGLSESDTADVYAVASKYNANVQLRNGSENDYRSEANAYITIAEALALEVGEEATVRGVVTFIDGKNAYVQDDTGAINLFLTAVCSELAIGDLVQAKGIRDNYKALPELKSIDPTNEEQFRIISSGNRLPIESTTLSDINADSAAFMCRRVLLSGVTLGTINLTGNTPIMQDGESVNVYRIPETEFVEGDVVNMIAIVSTYNNATQLRVVSAADITAHTELADPIGDDQFDEGVMTIPEVIAQPDSTSVTVIAQLVYRFGNYDSINSAILEDVIDGEIHGLQMFNSLDDYELGDVLKITATKTTYGGVPQIQSAVTVEKLYHEDPIPAQEFATFADMLAEKENLLSEYVKVRTVTLGVYNDNGSTIVTDSTGTNMPIYRAASYAPYLVTAGEVVDLCAALSKYSTTWQFRGGEYFGDNKAPIIILDTFLDAAVGVDYDVAVEVVDDYGVDTVIMTYTVGNATDTLVMALSPVNGKYRATVPGSAITAGSEYLELTFAAVDDHGLISEESTQVPIVDDPQVVEVFPKANSATHEDKTPEIKVEFANAGENPSITINVNGIEGTTSVEGNFAIFNYEGELEDAKYKAVVTIVREDGQSVEFSWIFFVGEPQYGFYFGQLHSHTAEYSDGAGTLEDVFNYVTGLPESENVQFVAITDHSNYFDNKTDLGDFENPESGIIAANGHSKWYNYTTQIDSFNTRQSDVIFIGGYEMTWSGQYGHMNTYNSVGFVSRQNSIYTVQGGAGLVAYYDLIKQYPDTIHAFNHPGTTFGNFENFGYYDVAADMVINMVEVGNGEGAIGGSAYWPSYEQYTLALDMGWHVAPTNNQDNHKGRWGNANTARSVVVTENFSEEGIYDAMRNRTMYATEDKNLEVLYMLNDAMMGTVIPHDEENPIEAVNIYASINDPDGESIGRVSVIVNGGITAHVEEVSGSSAVIEVTLPNDYSYYFLRIEQSDGDIAVTAPVWVGDVSKVGIADVTTETVIPVRDEEMTFVTDLYNYETENFTIESVSYYISIGQNAPVLLDTIEDAGIIALNSERQLSYNYTPTALGAQKFVVTVTGYLGETLMQFTHSYDMVVLDPSELLDVGIDYGHANFYVSGNYAGSDAAFIELMAQNAIRTNYIRAGELTYENIKDLSMLVLTVPYVGWQNVGEANLYSQDELDAIAQYAQNGGNLIVCSKSDRGDPANAAEMASTISNAILEAIGTDTRIVRGIVVDNEEKANEAYRLYFTSEDNYNYTWNGEPVWLLTDVLETTNNSFSCYNGAPVTPGANAIPVINGYSTTWGASYTDSFTGSNYVPNYETDTVTVPMGEVSVMTLENLPAGGWLITSGVTFFSTFEVQVEIENATTLQNSNYQLVMNIINSLIPEPTITPIAEVNAADEGVKFTVEGYVTSNASGYDQSTAFFDCIYVQDDTAGINLFPVAGDFHIGQYVRVTGVTGSYNGERELLVTKIEAVEGHEEQIIEPLELTAEEAMSTAYTGTLIKVNGTVEELGYSSDGALETIMVRDDTGVSRVFIDGYIMSDYIIEIAVGDRVFAIGLASITVDTESADGGFIPRIRVRNRAEIEVISPALPDIDGNGDCDTADALMILRCVMELIECDEETIARMD